MNIKDIFLQANIKCDDNVDTYVQMSYFNIGVNEINMRTGLQLPIIQTNQLNDYDYKVSKDEFVNNMVANILMTFIAYHTKKTEGYTNNENTFFSEYISLIMHFNSNYKQLIFDKYKLNDYQNGAVKQGHIHKVKALKRTRLW